MLATVRVYFIDINPLYEHRTIRHMYGKIESKRLASYEYVKDQRPNRRSNVYWKAIETPYVCKLDWGNRDIKRHLVQFWIVMQGITCA